MRLALAQDDLDIAEDRFKQLERVGVLSRENMRFLRVEVLARSRRWRELTDLPYFTELENVRRPRLVSEFMLEALWRALIEPGAPPLTQLRDLDIQAVHRPLLGSVDVPRLAGALRLTYLSAHEDGDERRMGRMLESVSGSARQSLVDLTWTVPEPTTTLDDPALEAHRLLGLSQYAAVVQLFLDRQLPELADPAVEAVLELNEPSHAAQVLEAVRTMLGTSLQPSRRLNRDLLDLERLVSGLCTDWSQWINRVASTERWGEAARVARDNASEWPPLPATESEAQALGDLLLVAADGPNADQLRAALDLVCGLAQEAISEPGQRPFLDQVLLLLSDQDNVSEPVRNAFNDLVWRILMSAPDAEAYTTLIGTASNMWARIASPNSVEWLLELLDAIASSPIPYHGVVDNLAAEVPARSAHFVSRLSKAEVASLRSLLSQIGFAPWPEMPETEVGVTDVWARLNSKTVGLYSLVDAAGPRLRERLDQLCTVRSIDHNRDTVATPGLRRLARSANYLIVDTWHAAHAATACIDEERPRSRQILPRRGGTPALLSALERALEAESVDAVA
jgi:hypothetical protein